MSRFSTVLDTNIFISALITRGSSARILDAWSQNKFVLYTSIDVINEIEAVGKRPVFRKYFSVEQLILLMNLIRQRSSFVVPKSEIPAQYKSPDKKDDIYTSLVLASKPAYFLTGNIKHFQKIRSLTNIMNPAQFTMLMDK